MVAMLMNLNVPFFPSHQRMFKVIVGSLCMWSWGKERAKLQAPHMPLQSDPII